MAVPIVPIWKDYIVDLGAPAVSGQPVPFIITSEDFGDTIFSGQAYPLPGQSNASVRINDICAEWAMKQASGDLGMTAKFGVYSLASGAPVQKGDVEFYNDWSFDPLFNHAVASLNDPITDTFAVGQFLFFSFGDLSGGDGHALIRWYDGSGTAAYGQFTYANTHPAWYTDYNTQLLLDTEKWTNTKLIPLSLATYAAAEQIVVYINLPSYRVIRTLTRSKACPRYVLYYRNAYGGWDSLPVEAKTDMTDQLTRHNTTRGYNNGYTDQRGKDNFVNEIRRTFRFHTGLLTETQAGKMHHLLNSTAVYLHDLGTDIVHSIVLTGSTTEYKAGRPGLFDYTIEAELAQERMRR